MTLLERIQQINAESKAWMEAAPERWAGMLTEDLNHWAEYKITTAEQLDEYLDACARQDDFEVAQSYVEYFDDVSNNLKGK